MTGLFVCHDCEDFHNLYALNLVSSESASPAHHAPARPAHHAPAHHAPAHHAPAHHAPAHHAPAHHAPAHHAPAHHAPTHPTHHTTQNGPHTIHSTHHTTPDTKTSQHTMQNGSNKIEMTHNSVKNGPSTTKITRHSENNGIHTVHESYHVTHPNGQHTIRNASHETQPSGHHVSQTSKQTIHNGVYDTQQGVHVLNHPDYITNNQYITTQNEGTYVRNIQNNEIPTQYQMSTNSIQMQKEYELEPQTPWGGPQKQSIDVSSDKYKLDDTVILAKILYIKARKQFVGNESSRSMFAMFIWSAKHRDKHFFKRLFDYANWQIFDININRQFSIYETNIITCIVSSHFVYAMNLLMENTKIIRLSASSLRQLRDFKASLNTLG
jgi:hypothetical protein